MTAHKRTRPPTAAEFYLDTRNHDRYEANNHKRGKSLLDHYIEDDLIRHLFARYLHNEQHILEVGAYTGRITRKLALYTDHITVSDTSQRLLTKFDRPKLVLDLRIDPSTINHPPVYDAIISIGHQVSLCGDISNAISVFDRLLSTRGVLIFDVWNADLPAKYDPPYPIQKATRQAVRGILRRHGFDTREYRSLCRLPYAFPKVFSWLFGRKGNRRLFRLLAKLEALVHLHGLFEGREHSLIFIATRSVSPSHSVGLHHDARLREGQSARNVQEREPERAIVQDLTARILRQGA